MQSRDHRVPGKDVGRIADEVSHLLRLEPAERNALAHTHDLAEEAWQSLHLALAVGTEEESPGTPQLRSEVRQEQDRALVGPVEIVEDEDDRLALGRPKEERGDAVEEPQAGLIGIAGR
jgi:hypothetical protein